MPSNIEVSQVHYPESDGKPMGETDEHRDEMVRHIELLRNYYRGQKVYVSGNLLVYYEQGNPRRFVVPDTFVVKGVDSRKRRIYKIWVERQVPNVVIETTSRKTKRKDTDEKPALFARLGVREYFLFDPDHEYLDPPLQGYRLGESGYIGIASDETGALMSDELDMKLRVEGGVLQFYRRDTGERLLTADERATLEAEARRVAEEEVERLREELARQSQR